MPLRVCCGKIKIRLSGHVRVGRSDRTVESSYQIGLQRQLNPAVESGVPIGRSNRAVKSGGPGWSTRAVTSRGRRVPSGLAGPRSPSRPAKQPPGTAGPNRRGPSARGPAVRGRPRTAVTFRTRQAGRPVDRLRPAARGPHHLTDCHLGEADARRRRTRGGGAREGEADARGRRTRTCRRSCHSNARALEWPHGIAEDADHGYDRAHGSPGLPTRVRLPLARDGPDPSGPRRTPGGPWRAAERACAAGCVRRVSAYECVGVASWTARCSGGGVGGPHRGQHADCERQTHGPRHTL